MKYKQNSVHLSRYEHGMVSVCASIVAYTLALRLRPIVRYGVLINEFDPWFNYRCSEYMWRNGIMKYFNWFDRSTWIPEGRDIAATTYPVLFVVSNLFHFFLHRFIRISHYTVCCTTPILLYLGCLFIFWKICAATFTSHSAVKRSVAVALFSLSGGLFEKTIAGAYDYESLSLLLSLSIIYTYILYIKEKSEGEKGGGWKKYKIFAAILLLQSIFRASWGGSIFTDVLLYGHSFFTFSSWRMLFVNTLVNMCVESILPFLKAGRAMNLLKIAHCFSMEVMYRIFTADKTGKIRYLFILCTGVILSLGGIYGIEKNGRMNEVLKHLAKKSKLYNLFIKKAAHPIVASITEHRPPALSQAIALCGPMVCAIPVLIVYGMEKIRKDSKNRSIDLFILESLVFSSFLFMRMERFAFLLAPFLSIFASDLFCNTLYALNASNGSKSLKKEGMKYFVKTAAKVAAAVSMAVHVYFSLCTVYNKSTQVIIAVQGISNNSKIIVDDFRESAVYMKHNLEKNSVIVSWWDYGYQITGMTGLSTVIDNNTNNYERISEVANLFVSPEENVSRDNPFLKRIVPDEKRDIYIYTVCGYTSKYNLSDLHKMQWIAKIAKEKNKEIDPESFYYKTEKKTFHNFQDVIDMDIRTQTLDGVPVSISSPLRESLLFKLCFYGHSDSIKLSNLQLVHESSNKIVRLYKVIK
ncbi:dolichyl-diphosphooligosaccharide---protein glycosyltransferase [Nematocida minor]|uniref:dolichyl-diphosphooligosaccharide---protein glycosyltransferase n=1 Tax=Nematocida minor TaxID=1912983 RepID=UPI00221FD9BE|nr:dolichyl-diphosphooligosaccharide---protein glycosyltransferase [Nematocida minor]KAI5192049.1 dolichyl-diphosphooligosaccharide---protein glycosyltransferase [Nematocida minor]